MIEGFQRDPTNIMGWYKEEALEPRKNNFPFIEVSARLGFLPMEDEAWVKTPNLYWYDKPEEKSSRKTCRDGGHGEPLPSEAFIVLNANNSMHSEHSQQPVLVWDPKPHGEFVSWAHQGEECTEASMDIEGDRGGTILDMV
nr:hypothetical protein CFP56_14657 [Quercus suber]